MPETDERVHQPRRCAIVGADDGVRCRLHERTHSRNVRGVEAANELTVDRQIRNEQRLAIASLARIDDPWQLYLYARVLHLYDDPRAGELYRHLLERHCDEHNWRRIDACAASVRLHKRVTM